jgi:DNA-binding GntR family transcriptional regulator
VKEHRKVIGEFRRGNAKAVEKALGSHFTKASEDLKRELIRTI